jgi:TetR/AcrR family transcriptional regulator, transcriptional repressor for nem operon
LLDGSRRLVYYGGVERDTRQVILEAGADLVHERGFHHTGLGDILQVAGVPKGSFYFYFRSKEDFGLALVDHHARRLAGAAEQLMAADGSPPLARLRRFFSGMREHFARHGYARGCPIGNLAQEMSDLSPPMRERVRGVMAGVSGRLSVLLAEARERGELPAGLDPARTASFLLDAWEGALLRMKVEKSQESLVRFEEFVFEKLLS